MNVNLLAIQVGNRRSHLGVFSDGQLTRSERVDHDDEAIGSLVSEMFAPIADAENAAIVVGSVNEPRTHAVVEAAEDATGRRALRVERDLNVAIGRKLDPESIVGDDRLLNAAAAFHRLQQACAIVDAGTAVTVDFLDGEGTFHGGAILPGTQMMLDALHERTAALPSMQFTRPDEAIGHSTGQAMLNGVFYGARGAARELIESYAELYGGYPSILATGGDAAALFEGYDLIEAIVPDLTLTGLAVSRHYQLHPEEFSE